MLTCDAVRLCCLPIGIVAFLAVAAMRGKAIEFHGFGDIEIVADGIEPTLVIAHATGIDRARRVA